jgi:hypothetical protein
MINFEKFSKAVSGFEKFDEWFPLFYYGDGAEDCITVGDLRSVVAAQQSVQVDLLPCGHNKFSSWDNRRSLCVACEVIASR